MGIGGYIIGCLLWIIDVGEVILLAWHWVEFVWQQGIQRCSCGLWYWRVVYWTFCRCLFVHRCFLFVNALRLSCFMLACGLFAISRRYTAYMGFFLPRCLLFFLADLVLIFGWQEGLGLGGVFFYSFLFDWPSFFLYCIATFLYGFFVFFDRLSENV